MIVEIMNMAYLMCLTGLIGLAIEDETNPFKGY